MTENNSITFYMLEDHKKIDDKLEKLLDGYGLDEKGIKDLFTDFLTNMERHMVTEEQAIFSFADLGSAKVANVVSELLTDHTQMRNLLAELQIEVQSGYPRGFENFVDLLKKHMKTENEVLYPLLDEELDEKQKEFIVKKIIADR